MLFIIMSERREKKEEEQEEILSEREEPSESVALVYGEQPVDMRCPYCLERIRSEIIMRPEFISVAMGMCIFAIVPNIVMMGLVLLLMQLTASRKHKCPLCEQQLGSDGKFLLYLTDQVYSVDFISAGMIFTKKLLITAGMILFTMTVLLARFTLNERDKWVDTTWNQFIGECLINEPDYCLYKYREKEFQDWEGHLLRIVDNREFPHKWYQHALSLYIKMDPSIADDTKPDILLTLDSQATNTNSQMLKLLQHGDLIKFNCSLHSRQRGSLRDIMHFHVDTLTIEGHHEQYARYLPRIEEEWIRLHLKDQNQLRSEPNPNQ